MANKFTQKAQNVLNLALHEAQTLGHSYVGSEHILLGLAGESDAVSARLLRAKGIEADKIRRTVVELSGSGSKSRVGASDMTPKARRIIEESAAEAQKHGSAFIGSEHILAALVAERDSVGAKILESCGATISELCAELDSYFISCAEKGRSGISARKKDNTKIGGAPTLSSYGRDLCALAASGRLDPIIGRENETQRVIRILSRRTKNNPCLVGEPGVGKTAVVEGLAQLIADKRVPENLRDKRIINLDISAMIAGAKYRGEFEERMKNVMEEVSRNRDIILFIDEIHVIVGAGAAEGAVDAANILKPALARGELQLIGATTLNEYRTRIEKDAALERRFQSVNVSEPTEQEAKEIIWGLRDRYEAHHGLRISDEAIDAAVRFSVRYIPDRFLPDKALDLIDEAASKLRIESYTPPSELRSIEERLDELARDKEEAIREQNFELAMSLRDKEAELRGELSELSAHWSSVSEGDRMTVTGEDVADIVRAWTSIPVNKLMEEEGARLLSLENELSKKIIGQDEAIKAVSSAIRRGRTGLSAQNRPIGSFIFLGKTGVGKTELAKALSELLFGSGDAMIRLDMSEYMERHSVSKLIGSPPGYVGYSEGGQLTERVRRRPYSLVLFDEIEKAHADVYNLLLQVLEDGCLTDSQGRKIDFKNTVLIMTSNIGADSEGRTRTLGFLQNVEDGERQAMCQQMLSALRKEFKPEFLNRVDDIIVFNDLSDDDILRIAKIMLDELALRAKGIGLEITFDESVPQWLCKGCSSNEYGARNLRRKIVSDIENFISEKLLSGGLSHGDSVCLFVDNNLLFLKEK